MNRGESVTMDNALIEKIKNIILTDFPQCQRISLSTDNYEYYNRNGLQFTMRKYKDASGVGYLINIVPDGN
jgi:hypothetical protein